jgi:hypothetical protein
MLEINRNKKGKPLEYKGNMEFLRYD